MLIFLYGQDTYRSYQKLKEIIDHYKKIHKTGLNLKFFDGENLNFQDFKKEIETVSMFQEKKLIVLKDIFSNKNFQEEFLKEGKKFVNSDNIILICEKKEVDKNSSFFQFLKKNSKSQEFKPLEGQNLKNWVKREFEKYQLKIENRALEKLVDFVGNNLWQLSNEIKKLVAFKKNQKIEQKDIENLVRPKIEIDIFKTIDALAGKNKKMALSLIHQHLERGDSPLYLLSMINFQFRNLLMIKSHQLGRELYANDMRIFSERLEMHPYVIRKTMQQTRKFTFEELKKIYQKIFQVDLNIKTGKIDPQTALDLLITEI